jgi:hypothetical protein
MCKNCIAVLKGTAENETLTEVEQMKFKYFAEDEQYDNCICGQDIKSRFHIMNTETEDVFIIGSQCIKYLFPKNDELILRVFRKKCQVCDTYVLKTGFDAHEKSKKHLAKYNDMLQGRRLAKLLKKYRMCEYCQEYRIPLKSTFKYCFPCNGLKKEKCSKCDEKISKRQHELFKMCYTCTSKKIEENKKIKFSFSR